MVGIALAALLAVADDVDAGTLLVADGEDRGIVLGRFQVFRADQPEVAGAHPRHLLGKFRPVDQPFRLRIGTNEAGRQHRNLGF